MNGQRTDALDLSVGFSVLANALAAFGASVPSLNVAYKSAHAVQFAYSNVTSTSVAPFDAGNYLAQGTLRTDNPVVRNYFLNEKSRAFLIVEVLKSDSITVSATGLARRRRGHRCAGDSGSGGRKDRCEAIGLFEFERHFHRTGRRDIRLFSSTDPSPG